MFRGLSQINKLLNYTLITRVFVGNPLEIVVLGPALCVVFNMSFALRLPSWTNASQVLVTLITLIFYLNVFKAIR